MNQDDNLSPTEYAELVRDARQLVAAVERAVRRTGAVFVTASGIAVAGMALGLDLVASVADFSLVEHVVLSGEGILLAAEHREALESVVRTRRPADDGPVMDVHGVDFTEWARGAAVLAIQEFVGAPSTVHPSLGE